MTKICYVGRQGLWRNILSIHLDSQDLLNVQQMEVAVNGPDGATHLILCTGIVKLSVSSSGMYTFTVGSKISRRQFVAAIASGTLSTIQAYGRNNLEIVADIDLAANLVLLHASYDDESSKVKVRVEVSSGIPIDKIAINYNVSILAELPRF